MKSIFIIVSFCAILSISLAAPSTLCIGGSIDSYSIKSLNPYEKGKLELYLADKYPEYYKIIRKLPCFDQKLNNIYQILDKVIFKNDDISLDALDLWLGLFDSDDRINKLISDTIKTNNFLMYKLKNLLSQEYPEYSENYEEVEI